MYAKNIIMKVNLVQKVDLNFPADKALSPVARQSQGKNAEKIVCLCLYGWKPG